MDHTTASGTATFNTWSVPTRIAVNEFSDRIEMIYKETSMMTLTAYPSPPPEERVFKVVFSCVDGKWDKSERIYGDIIPATTEGYQFES